MSIVTKMFDFEKKKNKLNSFLILKALSTLVSCSEGDLRKAITYLQCASRLKSVIKSSDILEIAGVQFLFF